MVELLHALLAPELWEWIFLVEAARPEWQAQVRDMGKRNREVQRVLRGDVVLRGRNENTLTSISDA